MPCIIDLIIKARINRIPGVRKLYYTLANKGFMTNSVCIDICTICNAKCVYCLHQVNKMINPALMDFDSFKNIIDILSFEKFKHVFLFMSGEPFLHPKIYAMINYVAKSGIDSTLDTRLNARIDFEQLKNIFVCI